MMKWRTLTVIAVAVLVTGTAITPAMAGTGIGTQTKQVGDLEADLVTITADVAPNGTATFEIRYAIRLADENESQAFEELSADIKANESTYVSRFADRMNATVDAARSATGREMSIGNFGVVANTSSSFGPEYGLVTYSATWTGFAAVEGNEISIGDAVAGLFIDSETQFRVEWDETYTMDAVAPDPTEEKETAVTWEGPLEFGDNEPSIRLVEQFSDGTTEAPPGTATTTSSPETDEDGLPLVPIAGGGALLAIIIGWLWHRQTSRETGSKAGPEVDEGDAGPGESGKASPASDLLSNEERVEQYLESAGGRAKQQEIIDALEWTEAKTSQVLSDMESAGTIEKFRIGRENVVKIPENGDQTE